MSQGKLSQKSKGQKTGKMASNKVVPVSNPVLPALQFPPPLSQGTPVTFVQKWCLANTAVLQSEPLFVLTRGSIVTVGRQNVHVAGSDASWAEIEYRYFRQPARGKDVWMEETVRGWVDEVYLEDYCDPYPQEVVRIENPTPSPKDARQYMIWPPGSGKERHNMCGELCVAYIVQKEIDPNSTLESVLRNWEKAGKRDSSSYNLGTVEDGTRDTHLKNILTLPEYGYSEKDIRTFSEVLSKTGRLDTTCLKDEIKTQYFIAQVIIEAMYGNLVSRDKSNISHWVLVEDITHDGNRVKLYNPFSNKLQEYSFSEFVASWKINLGLFVKRKTPLPPNPPKVSKLEVPLDTQKPLSIPAVQYILREGGKKTNLCGEFSIAYILGKSAGNVLSHWSSQPPAKLSELSTILKAYGCLRDNPSDPRSFTIGVVLDTWRDAQPDLYRYHVIDNQTTSPRELVSILKAYGYNHDDDIQGFESGLAGPGGPPADRVARRLLPSPGRIADRLKTYYLVAGVGIETTNGRLKARGSVRHWVVVERMEPIGRHFQASHFEGNGGWVELYNPFTDVMEEYSYLEFIHSMNDVGTFGANSGFWVKRDVRPLFEEQDRLLPIADDAGVKNSRKPKKKQLNERWNRAKLIEAIQKKLSQMIGSGKKAKPQVPPDAADRIAEQLSNSGWSREAIIREVTLLLPTSPVKPSPVSGFEQNLLKELGAGKTSPPPSLPADVLQLVRQHSQGDVKFAAQLVRALHETGFLLCDTNGQYSKRSFPEVPDLYQASIRDFMQELSSSQPDAAATDGGLSVKISNVIRPVLVSRALDEIK